MAAAAAAAAGSGADVTLGGPTAIAVKDKTGPLFNVPPFKDTGLDPGTMKNLCKVQRQIYETMARKKLLEKSGESGGGGVGLKVLANGGSPWNEIELIGCQLIGCQFRLFQSLRC